MGLNVWIHECKAVLRSIRKQRELPGERSRMVGGGDGNANKERLMINIGRMKVKDGGGGGGGGGH